MSAIDFIAADLGRSYIKGCRSKRIRIWDHDLRIWDHDFCALGTVCVCRNAKVVFPYAAACGTKILSGKQSFESAWGLNPKFGSYYESPENDCHQSKSGGLICGQLDAYEATTFTYFPTTFSHSFLSSSVPSRQVPASIHWRQGERF